MCWNAGIWGSAYAISLCRLLGDESQVEISVDDTANDDVATMGMNSFDATKNL